MMWIGNGGSGAIPGRGTRQGRLSSLHCQGMVAATVAISCSGPRIRTSSIEDDNLYSWLDASFVSTSDEEEYMPITYREAADAATVPVTEWQFSVAHTLQYLASSAAVRNPLPETVAHSSKLTYTPNDIHGKRMGNDCLDVEQDAPMTPMLFSNGIVNEHRPRNNNKELVSRAVLQVLINAPENSHGPDIASSPHGTTELASEASINVPNDSNKFSTVGNSTDAVVNLRSPMRAKSLICIGVHQQNKSFAEGGDCYAEPKLKSIELKECVHNNGTNGSSDGVEDDARSDQNCIEFQQIDAFADSDGLYFSALTDVPESSICCYHSAVADMLTKSGSIEIPLKKNATGLSKRALSASFAVDNLANECGEHDTENSSRGSAKVMLQAANFLEFWPTEPKDHKIHSSSLEIQLKTVPEIYTSKSESCVSTITDVPENCHITGHVINSQDAVARDVFPEMSSFEITQPDASKDLSSRAVPGSSAVANASEDVRQSYFHDHAHDAVPPISVVPLINVTVPSHQLKRKITEECINKAVCSSFLCSDQVLRNQSDTNGGSCNTGIRARHPSILSLIKNKIFRKNFKKCRKEASLKILRVATEPVANESSSDRMDGVHPDLYHVFDKVIEEMRIRMIVDKH